MTSSAVPWRISAVWIFLMLLTFMAIDPTSIRNWVVVTTMAVVPSLVLLRLWNDGPSPTVAEVLHAAENRR